MKKILLLFSLIMFVYGCSGDNDQSVSFSVSNINCDSNGGSFTIDISANCKWNIMPYSEWIDTDQLGGEGNYTLTVKVKENTDYDSRKGMISIISHDGSSKFDLNVSQESTKDIIENGNKNIVLDGEGGDFSINIRTNIEEVSVETPSWIIFKKDDSRALKDRSLNFMASYNHENKIRKGLIVIKGDEKQLVYNIEQKMIEILPVEIFFKEGNDLILTNNMEYKLNLEFYPEECTEKDLQWFSSDINVITVSNGVLKVVGNGDAKITAKSKLADVSASINVKVKVKATQIMLMDATAQIPSFVTWTFGYKAEVRYKTIPENAYIDDIVCTSSNQNVVSMVGGYLVASSSSEGASQIEIYEPYSGLSSIVNVTVKRCITYAGFRYINQAIDVLMMSFGGGVRVNNTVEVLSAILVDESSNALAMANQISAPSDWVRFSTDYINMTSIFGITVIDENRLPKLRFLVSYKCNGESQIYQEYMDVEMLTQVD